MPFVVPSLVRNVQRASRIVVVETHTLTSSDGVCSDLIISHGAPDLPVVVVLPAMGMPARKYEYLAEAFKEHGITTVTIELRGLGTSSVRASRNCNFGYREIVELDLPQALQHIKTVFPSQQLCLFGHSLGGQLGLLALAQQAVTDEGWADRLILSACGSIDYRGWPWPKNIFILTVTQLASIIAKLIGHFPGRSLGFAGREARTVISDWARTARTGQYTLDNTSFNYEQGKRPVNGILVNIPHMGEALLVSHGYYSPNSASQQDVVFRSGRSALFVKPPAGGFFVPT